MRREEEIDVKDMVACGSNVKDDETRRRWARRVGVDITDAVDALHWDLADAIQRLLVAPGLRSPEADERARREAASLAAKVLRGEISGGAPCPR